MVGIFQFFLVDYEPFLHLIMSSTFSICFPIICSVSQGKWIFIRELYVQVSTLTSLHRQPQGSFSAGYSCTILHLIELILQQAAYCEIVLIFSKHSLLLPEILSENKQNIHLTTRDQNLNENENMNDVVNLRSPYCQIITTPEEFPFTECFSRYQSDSVSKHGQIGKI